MPHRQRCLPSRQRCRHHPAAMPTHRQRCRPLPLLPAQHTAHTEHHSAHRCPGIPRRRGVVLPAPWRCGAGGCPVGTTAQHPQVAVSAQGATAATADGVNYVDGRGPASSTCTVAEDAAGDWLLPACVARASQAAWIAPVEPSAGERVGGKGAVQHGADWRAVSVHYELDCHCVRSCALSGGVHRGSGGLLRWQLPQGDPSSTHT